MNRTNASRSQQAINNLNNKVDQKQLARENRLLRWLAVIFVVALIITFISNPSVTQVDPNENDVQHLRDYSSSVSERSASQPYDRSVTASVN